MKDENEKVLRSQTAQIPGRQILSPCGIAYNASQLVSQPPAWGRLGGEVYQQFLRLSVEPRSAGIQHLGESRDVLLRLPQPQSRFASARKGTQDHHHPGLERVRRKGVHKSVPPNTAERSRRPLGRPGSRSWARQPGCTKSDPRVPTGCRAWCWLFKEQKGLTAALEGSPRLGFHASDALGESSSAGPGRAARCARRPAGTWL